jgi:hypothetical protein
MAAEIHVGDIGTEIRVQVTDEDGSVVDVSAAATRTLTLLPPGAAAVVVKTATAGSIQDPSKTGVLGWMHYTTVADDLDTPGWWTVQAYVDLGSWQGHTAMEKFQVKATL